VERAAGLPDGGGGVARRVRRQPRVWGAGSGDRVRGGGGGGGGGGGSSGDVDLTAQEADHLEFLFSGGGGGEGAAAADADGVVVLPPRVPFSTLTGLFKGGGATVPASAVRDWVSKRCAAPAANGGPTSPLRGGGGGGQAHAQHPPAPVGRCKFTLG